MWTSIVFICVLCALQTHNVMGGLSQAQRKAVLDAHNNARSGNLSPAPCTPLPPMTWDHSLARIAQHYANKCHYIHNHHRSHQARHFAYVGENLYITTATSEEPAAAVKSWDAERMHYSYDDPDCKKNNKVCGSCADKQQCGHYLQLVWNATVKVGCGIKHCMANKIKGYPFEERKNAAIFVCNYGQGGNIKGQHPYNAKCDGSSSVDTSALVSRSTGKTSGSIGVQLPTVFSIVLTTVLALLFAKGM